MFLLLLLCSSYFYFIILYLKINELCPGYSVHIRTSLSSYNSRKYKIPLEKKDFSIVFEKFLEIVPTSINNKKMFCSFQSDTTKGLLRKLRGLRDHMLSTIRCLHNFRFFQSTIADLVFKYETKIAHTIILVCYCILVL